MFHRKPKKRKDICRGGGGGGDPNPKLALTIGLLSSSATGSHQTRDQHWLHRNAAKEEQQRLSSNTLKSVESAEEDVNLGLLTIDP